jgi:hypothetical protein
MKTRCIAVLASLAALTAAASANAADLATPTGGRGQFVLDQISGFRASAAPSPNGAFSYSGMVGFAFSRLNYDKFDNSGGSETYTYTSFWLAPSLDWFPTDHLSIGGLVEISTTSGSFGDKENANAGVRTYDLPTTTNFTILPRIGYMIPLGGENARFAIWPRVGAGYAFRQFATAGNNNLDAKITYSGFELDADVGFLLRVNETFFFKLAPEFVWIPGTASRTVNNVSLSSSGSDINFLVQGGIGVML